MPENKVLIIGLDGATFDIINPLVAQGELPNIAKLMKTGCSGNLLSTVPHLSPVAWTTFFTGCNPGKHNIFDFFKKQPQHYDVKLCNYNDCKVKGVWDYANKAGMKVGIVNIPNTYPPPQVDGLFVSGMGTPNQQSEYTYPASLKQEIIDKFGSFEIFFEMQHSDNKMEPYLNLVNKVIDNQREVVNYLLSRKVWDIFIFVYTITDTVQHSCWKYLDKNHPDYNSPPSKKYRNVIYDVYKKCDAAIGEFLKYVDKNTTVILVSDHGQGPLYKTLSLNNWLKKKGYLVFKENYTRRPKKSLLSKIKKIPVFILSKFLPKDARDKLMFKNKEKMLSDVFRKASTFLENIDWSKTKAYCEGTFSFIYINKKEYYPEGIVDANELNALRNKLKEELLQIRDDERKVNIVSAVYTPEEIYSGESIENAPDLVIMLKDGYHSSGEIERTLFGITGDEIFTPHRWNGFHVPEGIFVINGPNIKNTGYHIDNAKIMDITPTVLYLMNREIPKDMDGKVLIDCFKDEYVNTNKINYSDETVYKEESKNGDELKNEDEEAVKKHLQDLGYL